jgi:hypothetical protein
MCDDAENLAGAGTDVLGPRKNLRRRVLYRRASHGRVSHAPGGGDDC